MYITIWRVIIDVDSFHVAEHIFDVETYTTTLKGKLNKFTLGQKLF